MAQFSGRVKQIIFEQNDLYNKPFMDDGFSEPCFASILQYALTTLLKQRCYGNT